MSGKNSVQVAIKVRPLFKKEKDQNIVWRVVDNSIQLIDSSAEPYCFDHIFDQDATNQIIFDKMAKQIVHSAIQGFNGTIFAYGQTSSGKTYTMMGDVNNPGVMVLAAKEIFNQIERTKDRQFLLRVGYIEIYNERIYDLLNKKNQDLKIHETNTGIVSVNCEEIIIRSEDDLLNHLDKGGKERTVGETNMNERSSRSHAIFRIIIESRKMDRSEDDAVIQSVINLVDLAGSERADQTGARGTRLKEGGHINKSLLFLSNVIKRLSENEDDKYISFRDSKLTRILQASLGGNALTAIICTIKPNATEETQSTLNFALRAKTIKNKPCVNENVSDATMMKRLEHEIKMLKLRLEEEQRKNESQLRVRQLEQRIKDEDLKIISCNSLHSSRNRENRRRTWCPSTTNLNVTTEREQPSNLPLPPMGSLLPSRLQAPKSYYNTPLITRIPQIQPTSEIKTVCGLPITPDDIPEIDEEFVPGELVNLEMLSPIQTPRQQRLQNKISMTPKLLDSPQSRCDELEVQLSKLTNSNKIANEQIAKYEAELAELKKTNEKLEMENREAVNLEFEFKRHKNKAKLRENELLDVLNDKEKEIAKLEKTVNTLSAELLQNSKEGLLQKSVNDSDGADEDGNICIKCKNLQRVLEENKKVTLEFEKLTLECEKLKLNYIEIETENERNKCKITHLEELQGKEKAECENLLLVVQELREKLKNVQRDYELLSSENSSKHEEYAALNREVEVARKEMVLLEEKYTKLELSWQVQQQTITDIEAQYAAIQTKYKQLQTEYDRLETTRDQSLTDYHRLEKENLELQTEIQDLKNKVHDAQHRLSEISKNNEEGYSPRNSKVHLENEKLKEQLLEIQTQFADLQKEYDDLSNQLMDNLQEGECIKNENIKLKEKLEDYEEKNQEIAKAEAEIGALKAQLENVLSSEGGNLLKTSSLCYNSSMRSSGVCVENDEDIVDSIQSQELLKEFFKLAESLTEIELEYANGKTKLFKNASKNSTPNSYKMCFKNILSVHKINKEEHDTEIENIRLEGFFKHSFHIVELSDNHDTSCEVGCNNIELNGCENISAEYIEKLKQEIAELKNICEQERLSKKSLLDNTERALSEMREQVTQLNAELLEKSIFVENCACKTYKQQIENLAKEKADITIMCEELQEKVNSTLNGSLLNITAQTTLSDDRLKELEELRRREQELIHSYEAQTKTLEEMVQRCIDMETNLEIAREQLKNQENEFKEQHNQLQLEMLEKLELSASEYRDNIKKYNKDWEKRKEQYEETIQSLQKQIESLKPAAIQEADLKIKIEQQNIFNNKENELEKQKLKDSPESSADSDPQDKVFLEDTETINQKTSDLKEEKDRVFPINDLETVNDNKCKLEEEKYNEVLPGDIMDAVNEDKCQGEEDKYKVLTENMETIYQEKCKLEEFLEHMREENRNQSEVIKLLDAKLVHLEERLADAKLLHVEVSRENSSLKSEMDDIREDLNCIPELHDKNQQLSDEMEKLNLEYTQLKEKYQKIEQQIQEFNKENSSREELIQTLQTKLTHLTVLEEEKNRLANDYDNLKQEYKQVFTKLQNAEQQIQDFCSEDANREELIRSLQIKLSNMTEMEIEKKNLEAESTQLKELLNKLQGKDEKSSEEIEKLLQNVSELEHAANILQLEKIQLEEKLNQIVSEYNALQTKKVLLDTQISELNEERKSLHEQCSALEEEKTTLEEQLKCANDKEKTEELLEQIIKEKSELTHNHHLLTEKLQTAQNQLCENEKHISCIILEKEQIQRDLQSLRESLTKTIDEKEKERQKSEQDKIILEQELQVLRQNMTKAIEEKDEQQEKIKACQQDNSQLKKALTKLQQENQEVQVALVEAKQEMKNVHQDLMTSKESLLNVIEQNQQEFNNLENDYEKAQQQLKVLNCDLNIFKEEQHKKFKENTQLQTELQTTKDSLNKLEESQRNLEEKLTHYQKLEEDKNNLETTLNVIKKAQNGALKRLQEEKDQLQKNLECYEEQNKEFHKREETFKQKIESLSQSLHEMRIKADSYEKLIIEHEDLESVLTSTTVANQELQQKIAQLTSERENHVSSIENLSIKITKLNIQLETHTEEKLMWQTKLSQLKQTLKDEQSSLQKENHELKSSLEELKLKCESLQERITHLENLNQQMKQQLNSAKENLTEFNSMQEELKTLKVQQTELKQSLKETVEEAQRCSSALRGDIEHHKELLQKQLENYNSMKVEMEAKQHSLSEENLKLSTCIEALKNEKLSIEEKLRVIAVRNFEQDLQRQAIDATSNTSTNSNNSHSPKGRKSLERIVGDKVPNISLEEKLSAMQQKNSTTADRRNRRLSAHDERRRQSYWGAVHDKETMTDPMDTSCNCVELDRKLKDCERSLFIKNSQVMALNMELKNHPLLEENAALKKRLQDEQDKHRNEIKRCKAKLQEQTHKAEKAMAVAAHATAKSAQVAANAELVSEQMVAPKVVANVEIQTDDDDESLSIQKLRGKYNDLKAICRGRYNTIKELQEKVEQKENSDGNTLPVHEATQFKMLKNQYESLENELKTVSVKYEQAKIVLSQRRDLIAKLHGQLEQYQ